MKRLLFFPLFFIARISSHSIPQEGTEPYRAAAQQWAHTVVRDVTPDAACVLLELTYLSYMRSQATLEVQNSYLNFIDTIGSGWNHILKTRLDPSKDEDFDTTTITPENLADYLQTFQKASVAHKDYVAIVQEIVTDKEKKYLSCKSLVDDLRQRARNVIAESLSAMITEIEEALLAAQQEICDAADFFKNHSHIKSAPIDRSLSDLLWYYVPTLMMQAFVNFDAGYCASSRVCLDAYLGSQQVSNTIWCAIEKPRAAYYAAHYHALFTLLQKNG